MVLGCFSIVGVGELIRVENRMRKEDYMQILEQYAIPPGCHLISRNFIMHQNKDLKHSSKLRKGFLLLKETQGVLDNMKSLDLNPIELLWEEIDRNIRFHCLTSKEHLWQILQEVQKNRKLETIKKLITRMPRMCQAVIRSKDGFFNEKAI